MLATQSRLIVDIERFRNDKDEPMAEKGMELYYTHTPEGKPFRLKSKGSYNKCLTIYDEYHRLLEEKVSKSLEKYGKCIILECHSFHDGMSYTGYDPKDFPDICIGINRENLPEAQQIINIFRENRYCVKMNEPFAGALVPLIYLKDERVDSIMIELNRRIYDGPDFKKIQDIFEQIYRTMTM